MRGVRGVRAPGRGGAVWRGIRGFRAVLFGLFVVGLLTWLLEGAHGQDFAGAEERAVGEAVSRMPVLRPDGVLSGTVVDGSGAIVPGALVTLAARDGRGTLEEVRSGADGSFAFGDLPAGHYTISIERTGFEAVDRGAELGAGERLDMGETALRPSAALAVEVRASGRDVAEAQVGLEEKQRVLGVFPNFYASYAANAEPLTAGEKFRLAGRFSVDPVAFVMAGVVAGSEQRANTFPGYGRGGGGYAKRFGAVYGDGLTSTLLGQAAFPALLRQDPRYFVKGTGSVKARAFYAVASMLMCRGDNRRRQVNYSNLFGNFASAGVSNAYYPAASRGVGLVVQNALMATAFGAVGGLFQEFLLHRMTPGLPE